MSFFKKTKNVESGQAQTNPDTPVDLDLDLGELWCETVCVLTGDGFFCIKGDGNISAFECSHFEKHKDAILKIAGTDESAVTVSLLIDIIDFAHRETGLDVYFVTDEGDARITRGHMDAWREEIAQLAAAGKYAKGDGSDLAGFVRGFGNHKVHYSTPFGDHVDGSQKLFLLQASDETALLPVFTSLPHAKAWFENAGRDGFLIMEGTLESVLETTDRINDADKAPVKIGLALEPAYCSAVILAKDVKGALSAIKAE